MKSKIKTPIKHIIKSVYFLIATVCFLNLTSCNTTNGEIIISNEIASKSSYINSNKFYKVYLRNTTTDKIMTYTVERVLKTEILKKNESDNSYKFYDHENSSKTYTYTLHPGELKRIGTTGSTEVFRDLKYNRTKSYKIVGEINNTSE